MEELSREERWIGSPAYRRFCTAAEVCQLNSWVARQLAAVRAEHDFFFRQLGGPEGGDGPALEAGG